MSFLNDKKRSILNHIVKNDEITSIQKLYYIVKMLYKNEHLTKKIVETFQLNIKYSK